MPSSPTYAAVAGGLCTLYRPTQLHILKIDNWFGPKWLRFYEQDIRVGGDPAAKADPAALGSKPGGL